MRHQHCVHAEARQGGTDLLAPFEALFLMLSRVLIEMDELLDAMLTYMFEKGLCLLPTQWGAKTQQTHNEENVMTIRR